MQIFILDLDPVKSAQYQCDKHCVKMPTESAQILCTVHHLIGKRTDIPYKKTHIHHPCVTWASKSMSNYNWLLSLLDAQLDEYTFRYKRIHKVRQVYSWLMFNKPSLPDIGLITFPLTMPDIYKTDDTVESFRNFYIGDKLGFAKYKYRKHPYWLNKYF